MDWAPSQHYSALRGWLGDSVSDSALRLALSRPRRLRRKQPTEIILHAYRDGFAPGQARLEDLGVPYTMVRAAGTSEDCAAPGVGLT